MHPIAIAAQNLSPSAPTIRDLVQDFYGPKGPLAELGWDIRPQQVQMSLDIVGLVEAFVTQPDRLPNGRFAEQRPKWGFVEAPCGTGKSLAYGVPGVLLALRAHALFKARQDKAEPKEPSKFIVTTANIALQEQLVRKDFPALAKMLGIEDLRVVLLKSKANYLCRYKIRALSGDLLVDDSIRRLLRWAGEDDCTGDKEDLTWDPGMAWYDVSSMSDECPGEACPHYNAKGDFQPCFWRKAKEGIADAHVIVTNHHYLALASGMKSCLLAVDESHDLEDSLRGCVSMQLSRFSGRGLASKFGSTKLFEEADVKRVVDRSVEYLSDRLGEWFEATATKDNQDLLPLVTAWLGGPGHVNFERARHNHEDIVRLLREVENRCFQFGCSTPNGRNMFPPAFKGDGDEQSVIAGKLAKGFEQLLGLSERYEAVMRCRPDGNWPSPALPWAFYVERSKSAKGDDKLTVQMVPADVSWAMEQIAAKYRVAVFTTATMPDYEPQRIALGLGMKHDAEGQEVGAPVPNFETRLPSPFPLARQGVLVVPQGPDPKDASWPEWAAAQVVRVVRTCRGGVLVLASSVRQMRAYTTALRAASNFGEPWDVRMQGESGRADLRAWFKNDVDGVLVATKSFFQGLDVQGDACRCVIIDRVPFARPDDPVEAAVGKLMVDRATEAGLNSTSAYMLRTIPQAAMTLAQGAGRLIRSQTDRGAVVVLDNRVLFSGAGWRALRASLPPFPLSRSVADIRTVLDGQAVAGLPEPKEVPVQGRVLRRRSAA